MLETLKADNLAKAIRLLPVAKNYPPETVTVYTYKKRQCESFKFIPVYNL